MSNLNEEEDKLEDRLNEKYDNFFYERRVPEKDELVMCKIVSIDEMGVICSLLEYNNLEGFLPLSEISRKRIRSVLRHVREGQKQVLQVLRVDNERKFTDLSKKYITPGEREAGTEKYNKGKTVHSISKFLAEKQGMDLEEMKKVIIYPLYQKYSHPFDAFRLLSLKDVDIYEGIEVETALKQELVNIVKKRMAVHPVKIGADIQITCYSDEGIDEIKKALKKGLEEGKDDDVKIQLISSPSYSIWLITIDDKYGKQVITRVINVIKETINQSNGSLSLLKEPRIVGKNENKPEEKDDQLHENM